MRVLIFTNDHKVKRKRIRASSLTFNISNRAYKNDPREIYITEYPKNDSWFKDYLHSPSPRAFYFENNPQPVGFIDGEFTDKSGEYLERAISINAVKQQSGGSLGKKIGPAIQALGSYLTLYNIFILIVAGTLAYSLISSLLGGGL